MKNVKDKKYRSIFLVLAHSEKKKELWDILDGIIEEGIIIEFDPGSNKGKVKSTHDGRIYLVDIRESAETEDELWPGDKILFTLLRDSRGDAVARILQSSVT